MDVRLGLSLLLLLFHISGALSKNIRDGPNSRTRQNRRASLSEFLVPPPPVNDRPPFMPPTNLAPPRPLSLPQRIRPPPRDNKHPTQEPSAYISRIMDWLNPFKMVADGGNSPSQQYGPPQQNQYGPPTQQYGPPQNQYGPPQQQYGPPSQQHGSPTQQYGPPTTQYGPPTQQYGLPSPQYGSPSPQYGSPSPQYGSPSPQYGSPSPQYGSPSSQYGPPSSHANQQLSTPSYPKFQPTSNYQSYQSNRGQDCFSCNSVPWIPIMGQSVMQRPSQYNSDYTGPTNNNYLPSKPDQSFGPTPNIQRHPDLDAFPSYTNTQSSVSSLNLHPGPIPPIYDKVQSFDTPPPEFDPAGSAGDYPSESLENHSDVYSDPTSSETGSDTKTVPRQSSLGGHLGLAGSDVKDSSNQLEVIPSYGTKISSEEIHYQQSSIIDVSGPTASHPPVVNNAHGTDTSPHGVDIINYIVSGPEDPEVSSQKTPSPIHSQVKHPIFKPPFEGKEIIRHEHGNYFGDSSLDTSIETFVTPTYLPSKKRNKQVQIIIPYTSQHTPSPFYLLNGDLQGSASSKESVKDSSSLHRDKVDDNVIGQESQNVQVMQLPHSSLHSSLADSFAKNNSIDVQRLQKNIDNWTIEEYSSGTTSSSILHNSSHPYLTQSKKIPHEYLTMSELNVTEKASDSLSDESTSSFGLDYDESFEPTTQVPQNDSSTESVENSTNVAIVNGRPWTSAEMELLWKTVPPTSSGEKEKVFVVTSRTISPTEFADSRTKKKVEDGRKKIKKKKKSYEPIERAYQVLPQAVNNLAVASTGPENIPLWGIMEHDDFTLEQKPKKRDNSTKNLSPVLFVGHSKVSRASR